jgi:hypothetical protein
MEDELRGITDGSLAFDHFLKSVSRPNGEKWTSRVAFRGKYRLVHGTGTATMPSLLNAKKPPGNRVAFSLGRIVPTEARPSELSWRHSMGGLLGCQGQIIFTVSYRFYAACQMCTRREHTQLLSPFLRHGNVLPQHKPR